MAKKYRMEMYPRISNHYCKKMDEEADEESIHEALSAISINSIQHINYINCLIDAVFRFIFIN